MQNAIKKLGIVMMSFLLIMTGFIINVGADNSEVYHNEDMSVVVSLDRNLHDNQLELNIETNSSEEVIVNDIKLNNESLVKNDYGYSAVVGENGNYKFIVELTRSILIQEENEETKTIERQETFEFSVEVNEIENIEETVQVETQEPATESDEEENHSVEVAPVEEPQSNNQVIKGITVTVLENGTKTLSSIPNQEDLALFIDENEYVSVDNETGLITVKEKQATDVVTRSARSTRAAGNNVTLGNKVVQSGDTITVTWRENRSYYWQLWGGISELFVNGERAYCLEPSVIDSVATPNASSTSLNSVNGVLVHPDGRLAFTPTQTQKRNLELISNYGYKYPGHQTAKYEWATKKLIWNEMGWDVSGGPNVDAEMNTIKNLIANHNVRPTWHNQVKQVRIGEVVDLSQNGLDKFVINNNLTTGLEVVEFSGNTLKVKVTSKNASLGLTKRGGSVQGTSYVYSDGNSQKVGSLKLGDPVFAIVDFEAKTGALELTKKGTDGNFYSGVQFELSKDKNSVTGTYTTDANGKVIITDLDEGTYFVREKSVPAPLVIDTTWKEVVVTADNTAKFEAINQIVKGSLNVIKTDVRDGSLIAGAEYSLFKPDGNLVSKSLTNIDGIASFVNLDLGDYYVMETVSPEGYRLDPNKYNVTITYKDSTTTVVTTNLNVTENREIEIGTTASFVERDKAQPNIVTLTDEVKYTNLVIGKEYTVNGVLMDKATGEPLLIDGNQVTGSTTFTATQEDGSVFVDFTFDASKLVTETIVVFEEMYDGERLVAVHKDINDRNQTIEVLTVKVTKIDINTKKPLAGAEFTRWDKDGNVVEVVKSNSDGIAVFKLFEGEYLKIKETNAPLGYLISDQVIELEGSKDVDGNLYQIEFPNTPKPAVSLPSTGVENTFNVMPLLLVLIGLLLVLAKKNENAIELVAEGSLEEEMTKSFTKINKIDFEVEHNKSKENADLEDNDQMTHLNQPDTKLKE